MEKPPKGYYRKLLPAGLSEIRLGLSGTPMRGVVLKRDLTETLLSVFKESTDPFSPYYYENLKNGTFVPLVECGFRENRVWGPGELFFNS